MIDDLDQVPALQKGSHRGQVRVSWLAVLEEILIADHPDEKENLVRWFAAIRTRIRNDEHIELDLFWLGMRVGRNEATRKKLGSELERVATRAKEVQDLREEDPRSWTYAALAAKFEVSIDTIKRDLGKKT